MSLQIDSCKVARCHVICFVTFSKMDANYLLVGKDFVLKISVQPALIKHLKIVKMRLLKTGACFIQLLDNVFAFCGN